MGQAPGFEHFMAELDPSTGATVAGAHSFPLQTYPSPQSLALLHCHAMQAFDSDGSGQS
jgi:hypothetical protein